MTGIRRLTMLIAFALVLGGCAQTEHAAPSCDENDADSIVLVAQSVPTADQVPCVDALPAGWFLNAVDVKSGSTSMQFGNDSFGDRFSVGLQFTGTCDTGDAVEVPSDEEEIQRLESVVDVENGYRGRRYYVFEGGCVVYDFDVRGDGWSAAVNDASTALGFRPRSALAAYVRENTRGLVEDL